MGKRVKKAPAKKSIGQYEHKGKGRVNNPPAGLVNSENDKEMPQKAYRYDPHIDPQLQWAGKSEHAEFNIPTTSLHVHERIDPRTIISSVRRRDAPGERQASLFEYAEENPPLREAVEFYKHSRNWSNRLIAGDSLLVMNSLLAKEGMVGQVQMVYFDPPYGIKYGSNFQPYIGKKEVKDGKDDDLSQEPEMIKAFRDTWELGIHSYLTYIRDRLMMARELLNESGSCFVQISDENLHHVKELLDEVFGKENFARLICLGKTSGLRSSLIANVFDYILWYAKDIKKIKFRPIFKEKVLGGPGATKYTKVLLADGTIRPATKQELCTGELEDGQHFCRNDDNLTSQGNPVFDFEWNGKVYSGQWKTTLEGLMRLGRANRLHEATATLGYIRLFDDFLATPLTNNWFDVGGIQSRTDPKIYVVQTSTEAVKRCMLMTTDPGDLVFDPTCGSGTTAYVAEQWGRRWMTCDTSRVAITLAKQRIMTARFPYYELASANEGVGGDFTYETVSHLTLESIATGNPPEQETLYDRPFIDNSKVRVTGPFTVESIQSPTVTPLSSVGETSYADVTIARRGETLRQSEWRSELAKTGIRGKCGQKIEFSRVESLPGTRWLHAEAETKEDQPQRAVISFGPEYATLDQKQVERALREAEKLVPKPSMVIFSSFKFDPEASKDIDEINWPGVTLLKAEMNADLLTEDLKKKRASNESFWLIGQPDIKISLIKEGPNKGKYFVEVRGFDYYNVKKGVIDSGGSDKIAMWMLDTDYDRRSLYPSQVFFPMAGENGGWSRLAKTLKAEIDEDLLEQYKGLKSIPFKPGPNECIAVKIIDDRGIESLKVIEVE